MPTDPMTLIDTLFGPHIDWKQVVLTVMTPVFLLAFAIEWQVMRKRGRTAPFDRREIIANLLLGGAYSLFEVAAHALIVAAGDCTVHSNLLYPRPHRLESVQNAVDQAKVAAATLLGKPQAYADLPWFWSDQFDVKLQIAGLGTGHDRIVTRPGDGQHGGSVWYFREGHLIAVDALNDARAFMIGKRLIEAGRSPAPSVVTDPGTDLKALLRG